MKTLRRRVIASVLSVVTALSMLLGSYVPAVAGEVTEQESAVTDSHSTVTVTTKEGIKITKSAEYLGDDIVEIKFKVEGSNTTIYKPQIAKSAVVFVIDTSDSMTGNKIKNAKAAAGSFAARRGRRWKRCADGPRRRAPAARI